ncbi:MAG: hypothetical protein Q9218_007194 [Villophora microphyllina]
MTQAPSPVRASDENLKPINSLCKIIQGTAGHGTYLGFLMEESTDGQRHNVFLAKDAAIPCARHKSLQELLHPSRRPDLEYRLTWQDSLKVAVTLASSVIHLDGTGWLKSQWSSRDIIFPLPEGSIAGEQEIDHSHPYASSGLESYTLSTKVEALRTVSHSSFAVHCCESLVALGITLVELCCGQTIEQLQKPRDVAANPAMTRWNTARRLQGYVFAEKGERYSSVVRRCLEGRFEVVSESLDDGELQQAVFDLAVVPLQMELKNYVMGFPQEL